MSGSIETAIKYTGIGRATYYRWQRRVRDGCARPSETKFIRAAEAACADRKMRCEQLLSKHMQKDWRPIAWWLARRYPNEYGRRCPPPLSDLDLLT
jgi:transposase